MFNLFKRDKPVENKDQQPGSVTDPNSAVPEQEGSNIPLNPAETFVDDSLDQPLNVTSSTGEAESQFQSEEGGVSPSPTAEGEPGKPGMKYSSPAVERAVDEPIPPEISTAQESKVPRKSLAYHLFSPETPVGRVLRPVLRWLATIIGLFALGLLAGYLLLYQPTQQALDEALARLATTDQIVSQKNQELESVQSSLNQAQLSLKQVQDKLDAAASENSLLIVMVDISNARVALVEKDGAAAKVAIEQAQSNLNQALSYIEKQDKVLSDLLKSRLDLIAKELVSDPQAALSDLGKLSSDLAGLHQKLFDE